MSPERIPEASGSSHFPVRALQTPGGSGGARASRERVLCWLGGLPGRRTRGRGSGVRGRASGRELGQDESLGCRGMYLMLSGNSQYAPNLVS